MLFGDHESYTLVIPANSARRFDLKFMLKEQELSSENKEFDELVLSYFDENNRIQAFHYAKVDSCWIEGPLALEKTWKTMNKRCRYAK